MSDKSEAQLVVLIGERLSGDGGLLPPHVIQKVRERVEAASRNRPSLVLRDRQDREGRSLTGDIPARQAFRFSLVYLAVLFMALGIDHVVSAHG